MTMITQVYFVRHALPDFSVRDDLTRPLTEKGLADSKKVTAALMGKNISAVYSSPSKRAIDTIKNFAEASALEIATMEDFSERRAGAWVEDFREYSKRQWEDFDYKLPGGESLREVQKRNISALFDALKDNSGKNIAIATHGTALSTMINYFNPGFGHADFWAIIDKMPYILCFKFKDKELDSIEKIQF
jgi:2,3-bisphosphoglycerate-dependent phosphoglycerate mutase